MQKILIEQLVMADLFSDVADTADKVNNNLATPVFAVCVVVFSAGAFIFGTISKNLGKSLMIGSVLAFALYTIAPTLFETLKTIIG